MRHKRHARFQLVSLACQRHPIFCSVEIFFILLSLELDKMCVALVNGQSFVTEWFTKLVVNVRLVLDVGQIKIIFLLGHSSFGMTWKSFQNWINLLTNSNKIWGKMFLNLLKLKSKCQSLIKQVFQSQQVIFLIFLTHLESIQTD